MNGKSAWQMLPAGLVQSGANNLSAPDDLIELARIAEPYGVKGWINLLPYSEDGTVLKSVKFWYVSGIKTAQPLFSAQNVFYPIAALQVKRHAGRFVAQIEGFSDRTDAESLKGASVWVSRACFPALKKGEYYWTDFVGLMVVNRQGVQLGRVLEMTDHGAHPIVVVTPDPALVSDQSAQLSIEYLLIPFVPIYIDEVNLGSGLLRVDWQADYS